MFSTRIFAPVGALLQELATPIKCFSSKSKLDIPIGRRGVTVTAWTSGTTSRAGVSVVVISVVDPIKI
jgi:hypothetical protein